MARRSRALRAPALCCYRKHPYDRDALRTLHRRYGEFTPLAEQVQLAWPPLVAGLHRLHFEGERSR